ncbi:DNA-binding transcriptional LysR family regulator [Paenibacillus taihuensis]|uniref:DNA-binding transcriptional LysR family regulator n=1 Tax=Paenibacillus taihuensis TaxID=1156355 RepID=A0A3D9SF23_9BACL|nr:LysR family transcriptional regulator [Paenibacillus taihuensis]REE94528.1 DNA-binding transcriptional LysR family regulator [Paenibacillus taihuensis]
MNLYGLIVFHHVATTGSVTRAAELLRISQPAVTAHVRNMAAELGMTLLAPKGRGILLTEAGERLAAHAARLFSLEQDITRDLAAFRDGSVGKLRIAATSLPANFLLLEQIAAFKQAFPSVAVTLDTRNANDAAEALYQYKADIAVIGGSGEAREGLTRHVLLEDELWFVAAPTHPLAGRNVSLGELFMEPFIMREEGSAARDRLLALCRIHGAAIPETAIQVSGVHESLHAVAAGLGVSFVSSLEAKRAIAREELTRVQVQGEAELRNPIVLYTRDEEMLPPAAQQFMKALLQSIQHEHTSF